MALSSITPRLYKTRLAKGIPRPQKNHLTRFFYFSTSPYESLDTPENRFAKFAAVGFRDRIVEAMHAGIDPSTQLGSWAVRTASKLDRLLGSGFYRGLSALGRVNLGSPVLQKRRGYRSILKAFLAARAGLSIGWPEFDELVEAETRDVPSLYEIWCLVQLRAALEAEFGVRLSQEHLRLGGGGLSLARGTAAMVDRPVQIGGGSFELKLWYNRNFAPIPQPLRQGRLEIRDPAPGTWTKAMKPDFTVELREKPVEGEASGTTSASLLVHFDAKYRLKSIDKTEGGNVAKAHAADDIDKMHAYLFGITDSLGAYVLYPGDFISYFRRSDLRSTIGAVAAVPGNSPHLGECIREILQAAVRDA